MVGSISAERSGARVLPVERNRPLRYVALGDSTVAGYGASGAEHAYVGRLFARLKAHYLAAQLLNLGVGGATAAGVVAGQLRRAVAAQPQLVTLSVGPNDITTGRNLGAFEPDLATIFATLRNETEAATVANLLPDLSLAPVLPLWAREAARDLTERINVALRRHGDRFGIEIVDLYAPSRAELPAHPECFPPMATTLPTAAMPPGRN